MKMFYNNKSVYEAFTFSLALSSSFFLLFSAPLGYFLLCGIFIKLLIYQVLQSLKIIIWYGKLLFGIKSYHLV